jgi:hypothetical protein
MYGAVISHSVSEGVRRIAARTIHRDAPIHKTSMINITIYNGRRLLHRL